MVDQDLYVLVICDKCEVILAVLPKYYQKATWKSGRPRGEVEEEKEIAAPAGGRKAEPGAAVIQALEKKKRQDDRRLRWS
jgi:hypothetical protein